MTDEIRAPWTPEQVAALNAFQLRGGMHPFTCGADHPGPSPALVARPDGWHCPGTYRTTCDYRQDWAHAFMADPNAWPKPFADLRRAPATEATEERNLVQALGGDRTAKVIARTLAVHGHTLNAVRTMTDAELFAVPGIAGTSLARIRAALDGCLEPDDTDQTGHATITDPEWLRQQYAAAVQPLLMDVLPKPIAAARAWEIVDTILFVRDRHLAQLQQRLELADAVLADPTPPQDVPHASQDGPQRPDAGAETPDGAGGRQTGADGRETLREQYAAAIRGCVEEGNIRYGYVADAVLAVRDAELERLRQQLDFASEAAKEGRSALTAAEQHRDQLAAAHIRDQSALAQIRLHIAAHRPRLQYADPILLRQIEAVLRQVGELEAAGGGS